MRVDERGLTSFIVGGAADRDLLYRDLSEALTSFEELEGGASKPRLLGEKPRLLLSRLRRSFKAVPERV